MIFALFARDVDPEVADPKSEDPDVTDPKSEDPDDPDPDNPDIEDDPKSHDNPFGNSLFPSSFGGRISSSSGASFC